MKKLVLLLLSLITFNAFAILSPIPVDEAYQISAMARDNQTLVVHWDIAPGYALYRNKFSFRASKGAQLAPPLIPFGIKKYDKILGHYSVFEANTNIAIPVINSQSSIVTLTVHYQGCANAGFCYPPQNRTFKLNLKGPYGILQAPITKTPTKSAPSKFNHLLASHNYLWIALGFFGFGILLSLTPCVLPMIPILSSIIIGQKKVSPKKGFLLALTYVLAMALTYACAGVIFGFIGANIQTAMQRPIVTLIFSLIFITMSLSLFGLFTFQLPSKLQNHLNTTNNKQKHGTFVGTFLMGVLATLILSPCVTPPLVGALTFISQTKSAFTGGFALFSLGIGTGIPLLIIGLFSGRLLPKAGHWMNTIKYLFGFLMLGVALYLLSRFIPNTLTMTLWGGLAISAAISFGVFKTQTLTKKVLPTLLLVYGILILAGSYLGNTNPLKPLPQRTKKLTGINFTQIKTIDNVENNLGKDKPVMLDFYASWCASCKEMEAYTFTHPTVKTALKNFTLLQANVTNGDAADKALEKKYGVIAPPTILFFNTRGQEIPNSKIVGEMSANAFLSHLNKIRRKTN